jgi:hypothetical protein
MHQLNIKTMAQNFIKTKEDFVCGHCGTEVVGDGYTNHCPKCLWSKHVDINPGDRSETCGGLMEAIGVELNQGKETIVHRCVKCSAVRRTKSVPPDDIGSFLSNMI